MSDENKNVRILLKEQLDAEGEVIQPKIALFEGKLCKGIKLPDLDKSVKCGQIYAVQDADKNIAIELTEQRMARGEILEPKTVLVEGKLCKSVELRDLDKGIKSDRIYAVNFNSAGEAQAKKKPAAKKPAEKKKK